MHCRYPKQITNPALKKWMREFHEFRGRDPTQAEIDEYLSITHSEIKMMIPCGKCLYCNQKRQKDWQVRLFAERDNSMCSFFVTLTYDDDNVTNGLNVSKDDVQKFFKRFRKQLLIPVRYFLISEYGPQGTRRPHYHMCLFFKDYIRIDEVYLNVDKSWRKGFIEVSDLQDGRIGYVSAYCLKYFNETPEGRLENFMLCSRRPFIGSDYLTDEVVNYHRKQTTPLTQINGFRFSLPRIYQDKLFDDEMRIKVRSKHQQYHAKTDQMRLMHINGCGSLANWDRSMTEQYRRDIYNARQKFKESKKL